MRPPHIDRDAVRAARPTYTAPVTPSSHPQRGDAGWANALIAVVASVLVVLLFVAVAHPWDAFEGHGDDLTHVLDEPFDPHPNDAGHRAIAAADTAALEEAR